MAERSGGGGKMEEGRTGIVYDERKQLIESFVHNLL